MLTNFEKVKEFHKTFLVKTFDKPELPSLAIEAMRCALIDEERKELTQALVADNLVETADALTDLLYVIYGFGDVCGIDLDACFAEVHKANMAKLNANGKPIFREDGKILKPDGWVAPDLAKVLQLQTIKSNLLLINHDKIANTCTAPAHQYAGEPNCLHCGSERPCPTISRKGE